MAFELILLGFPGIKTYHVRRTLFKTLLVFIFKEQSKNIVKKLKSPNL